MKDDNLKIDEKVRHHQYQHKGRFTLLALFSPDTVNSEITFNWHKGLFSYRTMSSQVYSFRFW